MMKKYNTPAVEFNCISIADCITTSGMGASGVERDVSYNKIWGTSAVDDEAGL